MRYVVYEKTSTRLISQLPGGPDVRSYSTIGAARAARTRFVKGQATYVKEDIGVCTAEEYTNGIEKTITVKSLMSGQDVQIPASTPWSCRPDSESYWAN